MTAQLPKKTLNLYDQDYQLWLETTASQLRKGKLAEVDLSYLIEEIESMSRSEKNSLTSNLQILLMYLLKYKYQPEQRSNSWLLTIFEHRDRILEAFDVSPSLKPYYQEHLDRCYAKARKKASLETGLPLTSFPSESPFTREEILDVDYLP